MIRREDFNDAITELVNVGVGRAAASLGTMVNEPIELSVPQLLTITFDELDRYLDLETQEDRLSMVQQEFGGRVGGTASILFPLESARRLVGLLTGGALSSEELDLEREAALTEVGNVVINSVMGTIGNITGMEIDYHLPEYLECRRMDLPETFRSHDLLLAMVLIAISGQEIRGHLILLFDLPSLQKLEEVIQRMSGEST